jgi:Fe-S-cluster-containing dehydrogenase component
MTVDRRKFLKFAMVTSSGLAAGSLCRADSGNAEETSPEHVGCLVDTTLCIGCRQCEKACNARNNLPRPTESFTTKQVFREERRHAEASFTVVNEYPGAPSPDQPQKENTYVKYQCMHCLDPACVSACITGALTKARDGAVIYNPTICIGCRYCMYACPFQVPDYEYDDPLTPRVRKCQYCTDVAKGTGANPACAAACPTEAIVFGKREELLEMARARIRRRPERYHDHIYGEKEIGGTSWLYLTGRPLEEIGLLKLPETAGPRLTENIQHTIFRYGAIPFAIYGTLGAIMWFNHRKEKLNKEQSGSVVHSEDEGGRHGSSRD